MRTPEERIAVALYLLRKSTQRRKRHAVTCRVDMDPEYYGPCTCGADAANEVPSEVREAIEILEGGGQ